MRTRVGRDNVHKRDQTMQLPTLRTTVDDAWLDVDANSEQGWHRIAHADDAALLNATTPSRISFCSMRGRAGMVKATPPPRTS